MKNIIALFCFMIAIGNVNAIEEKIVPSKISKVTVYSQGAQIFRTSSYTVGTGITEVIIEGVSPRIDTKSLQVKATGNVILLDSKYSVFYPQPEVVKLEGLPLKIRRGIQALEDSIELINFDIKELQDDIDVLVATKNILANNGAIRGQGKVNDSIALLKQAIDYYTVKMMEVNKKIQRLQRSKLKKVRIKNGMDQRLVDLKNHQSSTTPTKPLGPIHRITITLKSNQYAKGNLDISYLVSSAGWTPMYDLRSDVRGGNVNLNYKAHVFQNTGVDWNDVRLNISTNNPYLNKTKPTLHPWYVDYYAYRKENINKKAEAPRSQLLNQAEKIGYSEDAELNESSTENVYADALASHQFVEVVDNIISAEFRIDLPYTIASNNQQHMVLVKNIDLEANYKYYAVPKFDQSAYLVAQLTKLDELQLVPAKANIFFDGTYIGETYLDPTTMDDTLQLSLGKDPNIIVKRTLLTRECKEKVVGTKTEHTYAYAIEVKNLKSTAIDLVIQDQLPISQNPDIEIEALELSKGKVDKRTGIIEWDFSLKPKGNKDLKFTYEVKHDKDKKIYL